MASKEEVRKSLGKLVAKTWSDDEFKGRLMSDPNAVLKEDGIEVPDGLEVKVVENTDKVYHIILPPKPKEGELSDTELENVAGGGLLCAGGLGTPDSLCV